MVASPDWVRRPATVTDPDPMFRLIEFPFEPSLRLMIPPAVSVWDPTSIEWAAGELHCPVIFPFDASEPPPAIVRAVCWALWNTMFFTLVADESEGWVTNGAYPNSTMVKAEGGSVGVP